jgi:hypothetical protein
MTAFLKALREAISSEVCLVQLGDMYELWAGHPLEYVQTDEAVVKLKDKSSASSVGGWIGTIHDMHDDLFEQFELWNQRSNAMTVYLHGNHDSYLSVPAVVAEANKYIEMAYQTTYEWGTRQNFKKTTVQPRLRNFQYNGVFIEHGQRVDGPNRDGETFGWARTNDANNSPGKVLKTGDSIRRPSFVTGAATHWVVSEKNFGLYVMGHTGESCQNLGRPAESRTSRT